VPQRKHITTGIDRLGFYTSHYYLSMASLAKMRGVDVNKFHVGLGQFKMAVPAPDEDVVTMAANAAQSILNDVDVSAIDTLLFATESGVDQSKSAGVFVHGLLELPSSCRVVELKQACYSATHALQMACAWVDRHPDKKVLVIASDIARYGFHTSGESSQGCAAVAMLVTANPRILAIEHEHGVYTDDVMDFWRPNYREEALVEGRYSTKIYLHALEQTWQSYHRMSGRSFADHDYCLYHTPVPRLVEKAHKQLAERAGGVKLSDEQVKDQLGDALHYAREVGNSYSAALYMSLISLLDSNENDLANKRIGFYSYGSGCVAEYFSGVVQPGYRDALLSEQHKNMLKHRQVLTGKEYEDFFKVRLPADGTSMQLPEHQTGTFRLTGIENHKRMYKKKQLSASSHNVGSCAVSPGKLIISGEHAVVYGRPAIAMAVNRFVTTTVTPEDQETVSFHLLDLKYHKNVAVNTLRDLKASLKRKYNKFLNGEASITSVLKQPFQLAQFAAIHLIDHVSPKRVDGLKINTESTIPVGCGMGSSAAVTLSVLRALTQHYSMDIDQKRFLELAFEAERLQHGHPSPIDLNIAYHGGCIYFHDGKVQTRELPSIPMFLVNTGAPDASTGECVSEVAGHFAQDGIWDEFANVTNALDQALQQNDLPVIQDLIRENHRLLSKIGVVPKKVQRFIEELQAIGAAAKICGAGSVRGDHAGAVLVVHDNLEALEAVCKNYNYSIENVEAASQGLHVA
jgi:hydroxymethylglutaryl-CoA synthase